MTTRCVLYLPVTGRRRDRYLKQAREWSGAPGGQPITGVAATPEAVREALDAGDADAALVLTDSHRQQLEGVPVLQIPHQQARQAWATTGALGLGVWIVDWFRDRRVLAIAAGAGVTAAGLALAVLVEPDRPDHAGPPPATAAPSEASPPSRPSTMPLPVTAAPEDRTTPATAPETPMSAAAPPPAGAPSAEPAAAPSSPPARSTPEPSPTQRPSPSPTPPPVESTPPAPADDPCLTLELVVADLRVCLAHP